MARLQMICDDLPTSKALNNERVYRNPIDA
jgi:hypothetical protein